MSRRRAECSKSDSPNNWVGGALLGAILGAAISIAGEDPSSPVNEKTFANYLFYLNSVILIVSIFYITSIGITNVLRYHYMRELEDRLAILLPKSNNDGTFIHWMSFSSPITTRNPFHVKDSKYSIIHYVSYAISTILAVIFCIATTVFQYNNIKQLNWLITLSFIFTLLSMALSILIFIIISIKAPKMYLYAKQTALFKRTVRLAALELSATASPQSKLGLKSIFEIFLYYFYPKKKDFQKWFLILLGFITGAFLSGKSLTQFSTLKDFFICFLVVDFLMYQARYLLNDIRGIFEDAATEKTNRLPVKELGGKTAILLAIINIFIRVITAILISILYERNITIVLCSNIVIIAVISILYELSREYELDLCVFFLVSLGYPIRFFAGLCVAYPQVHIDLSSKIPPELSQTLILLFLYVSWRIFRNTPMDS